MKTALNIIALIGVACIVWSWAGAKFGAFRGHWDQFEQAAYLLFGFVLLIAAAVGGLLVWIF